MWVIDIGARKKQSGEVEVEGGGRIEGLEDKWVADEEDVYPSGLEREVEAVTEIVDTCVRTSWSIAFTLRLSKL